MARTVKPKGALPPGEVAHAEISPCETYRYLLSRSWGDGPHIVFFALNPSTANHERDDPTVRRFRGFAKQWGWAGFVVGTLYAFRTDEPAVMKRAQRAGIDVVGPEWARFVVPIVCTAEKVVCVWGDGCEPTRSAKVLAWLRKLGVPLFSMARTQRGEPGHLLYLSSNTELVAL